MWKEKQTAASHVKCFVDSLIHADFLPIQTLFGDRKLLWVTVVLLCHIV